MKEKGRRYWREVPDSVEELHGETEFSIECGGMQKERKFIQPGNERAICSGNVYPQRINEFTPTTGHQWKSRYLKAMASPSFAISKTSLPDPVSLQGTEAFCSPPLHLLPHLPEAPPLAPPHVHFHSHFPEMTPRLHFHSPAPTTLSSDTPLLLESWKRAVVLVRKVFEAAASRSFPSKVVGGTAGLAAVSRSRS
mmetsp:Transcript_54184/g.106012  ORF Transcript_54184/g.106012 Transcript_54184/m.106012 type:complete len:195 (+) Transcript_54184:328-912(+)